MSVGAFTNALRMTATSRVRQTGALAVYMKNTRSGLPFILSGLLLSFIALETSFAQTNESPAAAPIGKYAPMSRSTSSVFPFERTNAVPLFTLRLETNGTYFAESAFLPKLVQDGDLTRLRPDVARGTWHWDAAKREFRLEPGDFVFYIKCLPVDMQYTNRLVWGNSWLVREESK